MYDKRLTELGIATVEGTPDTVNLEMPITWGNPVKPGGEELMKVLRSPLGNIGGENTEGKENIVTVLVNMAVFYGDNKGKLHTDKGVRLFRFVDPNIESLIGQDKSKLSSISGSSTGGGPSGGPGE